MHRTIVLIVLLVWILLGSFVAWALVYGAEGPKRRKPESVENEQKGTERGPESEADRRMN